jgi:biotin transport system substrate-specific component
MTVSAATAIPFFPGLVAGSPARRIAAVLIGSWLLAALSQIEVPMVPVPMTMQTYAVIVIGALFGGRLAAETVAAYLVQGAAGLPFFAGGAAGALYVTGPTGGYLLGFLVAATVVGVLADRGWTTGWVRLAATMLLGEAVIFACGVAWLSTYLGVPKAFAGGFVPFVPGDLLKTALAVATVVAVNRGLARRDRP